MLCVHCLYTIGNPVWEYKEALIQDMMYERRKFGVVLLKQLKYMPVPGVNTGRFR